MNGIFGLLVTFWAMQAVAQVAFKFGSTAQSRWIWCFVLGNLFGASSIWLLMKLYARMGPNLVLALCTGGSFIACQVAVSLVFRSRTAPLQWVGYAAVVVGMVAASLAAPAKA